MALEVERRFLVDTNKLSTNECTSMFHIVQGYLNNSGDPFRIRARISTGMYGRRLSFLTLKNKIATGTNKEFEYDIPVGDAEEIIHSCGTNVVSKMRHNIGRFEVDFFEGALQGIVIAEIELTDIDEIFESPIWLGREITNVKGLSNFDMALTPDLSKRIFQTLGTEDEF